MKSCLRLFAVACALAASAVAHAAKPEKPVPPPDVAVLTTPIPASKPIAEVEAALQAAFESQSWTIVSHEPGKLVATRDQNTYNARVTATCGAQGIEYFSDSWKVKKKSREKTKPAVPMGWIRAVDRAAKVQLGLAKPSKKKPKPSDS